jgi:hypothetical protein
MKTHQPEDNMAKKIKGKGRRKIIKIPLLWQFFTWLTMIPVAGGCFLYPPSP